MANGDNYYQRRLEEELAAAERASDAAIAQIHREMAQLYRTKLNGNSDSASRDAGGARLVDEPVAGSGPLFT